MDLVEGIAKQLWSAEQLGDRVSELAGQLTRDYRGSRPLMVGILNGCVPFLSDLMRAVPLPLEMDVMAVSSYGGAATSSGVVRILKDLGQRIEGRDVVLVEDIIDTGVTLRYLRENLMTRRPNSLRVCVLLDKHEARTEPVEVDYVGFECPMEFVVGYGLDYAGLYRNLPYIGVLDPSVYGGGP